MASKKKQHFIPRFYLRFFSNENKKTIGIWHIQKELFIHSGNLRNQAYQNNFYGKDSVIEDALAKIESIVSFIFKNIINKRKLPKKSQRYN